MRSPTFAVYTEMAHVKTASVNAKKEATFASYNFQFVIKFFTRRKTLKCRPRPSARATTMTKYVMERWEGWSVWWRDGKESEAQWLVHCDER